MIEWFTIYMIGGKKMKEKIPCSVCGDETNTPKGYHLRYNINFCSEKCMYDFIEEFMVMTFGSVKNSEKKVALLEKKLNNIIKSQKIRKK
jgi:hypothetical protein